VQTRAGAAAEPALPLVAMALPLALAAPEAPLAPMALVARVALVALVAPMREVDVRLRLFFMASRR